MTDALIAAAIQVRDNAHATFSNFKVGAAVQDDTGRIHTGCNVENATYGLTVCAERVAIFKAISEGARRFTCVAVVADTETLTPPCGACRQILWEFCGDVESFSPTWPVKPKPCISLLYSQGPSMRHSSNTRLVRALLTALVFVTAIHAAPATSS